MGRGKQTQRKSFKKEVATAKKNNASHSKNTDFTDEDMDDEIDIFHKQRGKVPLDLNDDEDASDEEMEQPVFDLQGESSEDLEESESDDEEQLTGLAAKIAKQANFLRQKAGGVEDEMEEEVVEEEEERKAVWGKGKKSYYNADNVDFELQSSDEELPAEEEAEVLRLQRKKAESLLPEDFGLDEDEKDESDADLGVHEETLQEAVKRHDYRPRKKLKEISNIDLAKQVDDDKVVTFKEVKKDINALSKEQQMEVVMSDAPELLGLLSEFKDSLDQLKNVEPLLQKVKANENATKEGINYLEVKQLVLLCYCQSIVFYLLLKAEGRSVRDHPVISRLVEIRNFLEKVRPIDDKLKDQCDKILTADNGALVESTVAKAAKNSISLEGVLPEVGTNSVMVKSKIDLSNEVCEDKDELLTSSTKKVEETVAAESKQMLKERAKLEAYMMQLKDGFNQVIQKSEKTKRNHIKRPRNGLLETIDDFDDDVATTKEKSNYYLDGLEQSRKLSQVVAEAGRVKKPKLVSGDQDLPEREDLGERRRRHEMVKSGRSQSPDNGSEEKIDEDPEGSEDEFYREVKQQRTAKLAANAETYSRKLRIPTQEEEIEGKRRITYQMDKNKGLTPHRKKLTKIPRKKYKMKHQKAVIRRKGQVRDVRKPKGPYAGEATGIRTGISRSIRFKN